MIGVLKNMVNAHIKMGKPKKGIENLEAALTLAKKMGSKKNQGIILKKLGDFYQKLKQFEKASPKFARVQILNLSTVCSIAWVKLIQN